MNLSLVIIIVLAGFLGVNQKSDLQKQTNNPIYQKIETYKLSCNEQNSSTCTKLADEYYTMRDFENSYPLYKKMCEKNDQEACRMQGESLSSGTGVPKDKKSAFKVFKKSCNTGYMASCSRVGLMYYFGRGVKKDLQKSIEYFTLACKNRDKRACESKNKIEKGIEKVKKLEKSCTMKNAKDCRELAIQYIAGDYVKADEKKFIKFSKKACNGGVKVSCFDLARKEKGEVKMEKLKKLCDGGYGAVCRYLAYEYRAKFRKALKKGCELNDTLSCKQIDK